VINVSNRSKVTQFKFTKLMGYGMGFGIWDLGFGIWDLGFGIGMGMGFGIWDGMGWDGTPIPFIWAASIPEKEFEDTLFQ
jgi:hypothetical protein